MKGSKKKIKTTVKEEVDSEFDELMEEFAEVIVEGERDEHVSELEPFELYAFRAKAKIHHNLKEFRSRFAKGYHVLIEELQKESQPRKNLEQEPPKPGSIRP